MSGGDRKPWHDDDGFWQTMGPTLFTRERWANVTVEMDQILGMLEPEAECGFTDAETFGDLSGAPYDHNAKRLGVRARKQEKPPDHT